MIVRKGHSCPLLRKAAFITCLYHHMLSFLNENRTVDAPRSRMTSCHVLSAWRLGGRWWRSIIIIIFCCDGDGVTRDWGIPFIFVMRQVYFKQQGSLV